MTAQADQGNGRRMERWRVAIWIVAALLLALPLVAMQFSREVNWTMSDFVFAAIMLATACGTLELAARASGNFPYRAGVAFAVGASFLLVWVNGAVGFLGDEDNPANLMFLGVIAIAIIGSVFAGFRPAGMARAMFAAAAAQVAAALIGLAAGWASPGGGGVYEVVLGTSLFTPLWLASALLFRKAAR